LASAAAAAASGVDVERIPQFSLVSHVPYYSSSVVLSESLCVCVCVCSNV